MNILDIEVPLGASTTHRGKDARLRVSDRRSPGKSAESSHPCITNRQRLDKVRAEDNG